MMQFAGSRSIDICGKEHAPAMLATADQSIPSVYQMLVGEVEHDMKKEDVVKRKEPLRRRKAAFELEVKALHYLQAP